LPTSVEAESFDFESHTRAALLSIAPEDGHEAALAKLRSASASLFLGRARQGIRSGHFTDLQPHFDAVLDRRGDSSLPTLQYELDLLRSKPLERGNEESASQRAKALFGLICAVKLCRCT